jgi:antitoxin (DNA-binding transcriptional repressor) of toxin-antitoxin stability system
MHCVTLKEAEGHLAELVALADSGEDVVIQLSDKRTIKLVLTTDEQPREFGQFRGKVHIADDFDESLDESFLIGDSH